MPIYDYVCPNGHRFEVIHGINAPGPSECPVCGSTQVRKGFVTPTIVFKGSGWAKKDRSAAARSRAASSDGKESGDGATKEAEPSTPAAASAADGVGTKGAGTSPTGGAGSAGAETSPTGGAGSAGSAGSDSNASSRSRSSDKTGSNDRNRPSSKSEPKVEGA
jgi:putative FmdB family regulatory protein